MDGLVAIVYDISGVTLLLQALLNEAGDLPFVFNYQDAHAVLVRLPPLFPLAVGLTLTRESSHCTVDSLTLSAVVADCGSN